MGLAIKLFPQLQACFRFWNFELHNAPYCRKSIASHNFSQVHGSKYGSTIFYKRVGVGQIIIIKIFNKISTRQRKKKEKKEKKKSTCPRTNTTLTLNVSIAWRSNCRKKCKTKYIIKEIGFKEYKIHNSETHIPHSLHLLSIPWYWSPCRQIEIQHYQQIVSLAFEKAPLQELCIVLHYYWE